MRETKVRSWGPVLAFALAGALIASALSAPGNRLAWFGVVLAIGLILTVPAQSIYLTFAEKRLLRRLEREAADAMLSFIGTKPDFINTKGAACKGKNFMASGTGIAITATDLYVLDEGEIAQIPFSSIRQWEWHLPTRTQFRAIGGNAANPGPSLQALELTRTSAYHAGLASGLLVHVKDIDKPVWQFRTSDESILRRWVEILNQRLIDPNQRTPRT